MKNLIFVLFVLISQITIAQEFEKSSSLILSENNIKYFPYSSNSKGPLYFNVYVNNQSTPYASTTGYSVEIDSSYLLAGGNITLCVEAVYITGVSDKACLNMWLPPQNIQTIEKDKIKIYPNPAKDLLNIISNNEIQTIKIFNILGKELSFFEVNNKDYKMDLSDFQAGFYLISTKTENGESIQKINIVK